MTKNEIIDHIAEILNDRLVGDFHRQDAKSLYESLFDRGGLFTEGLVRGEKVQLTGFGTLQRKARKARTVYIPTTEEKKTVPAKSTVTFHIGSVLAEEVNK